MEVYRNFVKAGETVVVMDDDVVDHELVFTTARSRL